MAKYILFILCELIKDALLEVGPGLAFRLMEKSSLGDLGGAADRRASHAQMVRWDKPGSFRSQVEHKGDGTGLKIFLSVGGRGYWILGVLSMMAQNFVE